MDLVLMMQSSPTPDNLRPARTESGRGRKDTMSTPEPEPDWEAKFHKAVSDNVRQADAHKRRTAEVHTALNVANQRIKELMEQVRQLTPAANARKAMQDKFDKELALERQQNQDLQDRNIALATQISRGHRGVLEDVIADLTYRASRLPAPTDVDRIPTPPVS